MVRENEYNAGNIQVLTGLEPVRKRPGMYIGSTGPKGLHHLVYEVVDNSIDEILAGRCDQVIVELNNDGSVSVRDNGSGIPVDIHPQTKKSTVETVLTILHAGENSTAMPTKSPAACTASAFLSSTPCRKNSSPTCGGREKPMNRSFPGAFLKRSSPS